MCHLPLGCLVPDCLRLCILPATPAQIVALAGHDGDVVPPGNVGDGAEPLQAHLQGMHTKLF